MGSPSRSATRKESYGRKCWRELGKRRSIISCIALMSDFFAFLTRNIPAHLQADEFHVYGVRDFYFGSAHLFSRRKLHNKGFPEYFLAFVLVYVPADDHDGLFPLDDFAHSLAADVRVADRVEYTEWRGVGKQY